MSEPNLPDQIESPGGAFFRAAFAHMEQFGLILSPDGRVAEANPTILDFCGLRREEVVNRPLWDAFWPDAQGAALARQGAMLAAVGRPFRAEIELLGRDGQTAVLDLAFKPLRDEAGQIRWLLVAGDDIAYLRETETRLEESQALLSEAQRAAYLGKIKSRRHTRKTTSLLRAANVALTETLDLAKVLETLLEYLDALAPYDSGEILLRRNSGGLILYAWRGYGRRPSWRPGSLEEFAHLAAVFNSKESLSLADVERRPDWRPHFAEAGETGSWLGIPLAVGGQVIGLCSLHHREPNHFNDEQRALAETLVAQAAIAIQNARWFTELRASREELRELAQRVVTVQEEERRRVSRELHDEAGQSLTALKLSLEMIHADLPPDLGLIDQSLAEAIELTDETMERIRRLAHGLRPPALDALGLNAALEGLCREVGQRAGLEMVYDGRELPRLPDTMAIALYRFVQEALTNVIKHANASRVTVALQQQGDQLRLVVADDGQGLADDGRRSPTADLSGLGLTGMAERLMLLEGRLEISSQPGQGVRLTATAPLPASQEAA